MELLFTVKAHVGVYIIILIWMLYANRELVIEECYELGFIQTLLMYVLASFGRFIGIEICIWLIYFCFLA